MNGFSKTPKLKPSQKQAWPLAILAVAIVAGVGFSCYQKLNVDLSLAIAATAGIAALAAALAMAMLYHRREVRLLTRDIDERKEQQAEIRRLNQIYAVLSQVNQAVVHLTSVQELFPRVCQVAIEFGGFRLAWIGRFDPDTQEVTPVACAGEGSSCLFKIKVYADDRPEGGGLAGSCIREDRTCLCNDFIHHLHSAPWREGVVASNLHSAISLPIHQGGKVCAVLMVYATENDVFQSKEVKLLEEVANDISFAIDNFDKEQCRRRAEEAQSRSEKRLHQLSQAVEQSPVTVMITDTKGDIEYVNRKFTDLTGYNSEEVIGKNPRILNSGETQPEGYTELWRTIVAGGEWRGEFHNKKKSGELFWESASICPITDKNGVTTHFLAIKEDITERKQIEERLLRSQRLESIGLLAGGLAHDLNNILAPIMMSASTLHEEMPPETHETLVSTIEEAAERGRDILKQVLTFARGVGGRQVVLNPQFLVGQVTRIVQETFPRSITLCAPPANDVWNVTGDLTQLHQVLLNLCVNARDAMPNGGILEVSAENCEVDENFAAAEPDAKPGRYVVLRVTDSGTGIPRAIIHKIFDPFYTTKELGKGTGLGLSAALGIVRSHGGFLTVESQERKGATFRAYIPATANQECHAVGGQDAIVEPGNGETILVVDDEVEILKVISTILTRNRYEVITASDGVEALTTYLKNPRIKVILTDLMMPHMGGINLVRALAKVAPEVAIIAATGHGEEIHENELRELGVHTILKKPFNADRLLRAIHEMICFRNGRELA